MEHRSDTLFRKELQKHTVGNAAVQDVDPVHAASNRLRAVGELGQHSAADQAVPVENSLLFASALSRAKVPFELHVFPKGRHGMSLANAETSMGRPEMEDEAVAAWVALALRFLRTLE